ncbi:hypothetical protein NDR87_03955 [Nocardia sp. CDC159]|uniref:HicB-like protein involved in pilus formation n=1 Tax=Nocardia pulmonis TaxID=2951408 RepID=A0A9X2IW52_9NOCA|nr:MULTISPECIES: hypothetical protein [Nocardia]MCM6773184.1 hypothetical protein [Nocardia pulmonis]MCM6785513.1 hypothetical protein [Nocardia sp. CDC159]
MDLAQYVDTLRRELALAADGRSDEVRAFAERLVPSLESATRLMLLAALSHAADEITRDLAPGSVEVRLRGTDPHFVVTPPMGDPDVAEAGDRDGEQGRALVPPPLPNGDEGAATRINLRLPESLKAQIEDAAMRAGLSINAWLVRAAAAALTDGQTSTAARTAGPRRDRYTGWVR